MTQNINTMAPKSMGSITRIGTTENGRGIYQVKQSDGKVAGKISVAAEHCDTFEKSYNELKENAPKLQRFMEKHGSPEEMKKRQRKAKNLTLLLTAIGTAIPMLLVKGKTWKKQVPLTLLGTIVGLGTGLFAGIKLNTPPGGLAVTKATQNLSKLDVQPMLD